MADKITRKMVLKVDLECPKCYRKIKKVLAKFPQIREQSYDVKQNTVTITVECCSPEKLRDKLCCKGGKTIKSIEIIEPPKPKPTEKPKEPENPKQPEKPKEPEKPKQPEKPEKPKEPKQPEKPKEPEKPKQPKEPEKPKQPEKPNEPKETEKPKPKPNPPPPVPVHPVHVPVPVPGYPPGYPHGACCGSCYEGRGGGPCYQGYDNYGYGANRGGYCRCDYFSEENTSGCTIM